MIPKDKLEKYKEIYRSEYGKEISDQDTLKEFTALITFMDAVWKHQNHIVDDKSPILCKENHHSVLATKD